MPRRVVVMVAVLLFAARGSEDTGDPAGAGPTTAVGESEPTGSTAPENPEASPDQTAPVQVDGAPLTPTEEVGLVDDPELDPVLGSMAPVFSGTDYAGETVTIGPDGRPKVVYFLAHWCGHCQDEVRTINDLVAGGSLPEGLDLYAVSIAVRDDQPNYPPSAWLAGFPAAVMRDSVDSEAASAAGVSGIPYALYLDGDHRVLARSVGSLGADAIAGQWARLATG